MNKGNNNPLPTYEELKAKILADKVARKEENDLKRLLLVTKRAEDARLKRLEKENLIKNIIKGIK